MRQNLPKVVFAQLLDVRGYPPVVNLMESMLKDRWEVRLLAWESAALDQFGYLPHLERCIAFARRSSKKKLVRLFNAAVYLVKATIFCMKTRPALVVISDPPSAFLGMILASVLRLNVIYFEFDSLEPAVTPREALRTWTVRRLAHSSLLNVLPNDLRARNFAEKYQTEQSAMVFFNFPMLQEFVLPEAETQRHDGRLRLYYQGSFGSDRMPMTLLAAMAVHEKVDLELLPVIAAIAGADKYLSDFLAEAARLGLKDRIVIHSNRSADQLAQIGAACDIGIAFYDSSPEANCNLRNMWGASNKVVQYFAYKLTALYSTDEAAFHQHLAGIAVSCNMHDPQDLSAKLGALIADAPQLQALKAAAYDRARRDWTFERQYEKLGPLLAQVSR